ncbi:MAG: Gfo/Idh/MocA family oxidoreductase [Syntrophomonadaceae bacterium]
MKNKGDNRCLVVGYGSIGARHARVLSELGCRVSVVSMHERSFPTVYKELASAMKESDYDYVIIANRTSEHYQTLKDLSDLGYSGIVLVEKPLFENYYSFDISKFEKVLVGYNLRFHPLITRLKVLLDNDLILSTQAYVGQYLPQWRPERDYSQCYSSDKASGGGVIRDLSHELDYLNWLLGGWKRLVARGGTFSSLAINSDDFYCIMLETLKSPLVNVQLNYMDRITQRQIIMVGEKNTYVADMIRGCININGEEESFVVDRDFTYRAMHEAVLNQDYSTLCSYQEGMEVLKIIQSAESSNSNERWAYNE